MLKVLPTISSNNKCSLSYIPKRLHWGSKKKINVFFLNEELYWRCDQSNFDNPYTSISLADVSINRQGNPKSPISHPSDVLYDTTDSLNEKYHKGVIVLEIKKINQPYVKEYNLIDANNININVKMELLHDPLCCMFPHCIFQFRLNNSIVTIENYKKTFGKDNKHLSRLRKSCKDELTRMIKLKIVEF